LQKIIKTGLLSLANSLSSYWPAYDDLGISERNLSVHVASAFINSGFDAFFEVPLSEDDKKKKIDSLFISYEHKLFVATESKKLYGVGKAKEITDDIIRIEEFVLQDDDIEIQTSYGLILAETWEPDIAAWWISDEDYEDIDGFDAKRWITLGNMMEKAEVEAITLYHESEQSVHKALYALWPIE
jgi:hypothetical protein